MIPLRDDNACELRPVMTVVLIALCVLTFLWQQNLDVQARQLAILKLGVIPAVLFDHARLAPEWASIPAEWTVLSSMFLHGGWMHLLGNMLFLWIFGNNVEAAMGHVRYVLFYLTCGIAAAFAQALPDPHSSIPMVGASGAISGVLGAYLLLYPHARVLVLIPLGFLTQFVEIPAMVALGLWFLIQLVSGWMAPATGGGVAFGAHIGGILAGMALIPIFKYARIPLFQPAHPRRGV